MILVGVGKDFFKRLQKVLIVKKKIDNLEYIKSRNFSLSRETSKRVKKQPEEEKIFTIYWLSKDPLNK